MCSILGFSGSLHRGQWPQVHHLLTELFIASAVRGADAAGFAAVESTTSGKCVVTDKRPFASPLFTAKSSAWRKLRRSSCVIAHCRAATHGSPHAPGNRNNHPFIAPDQSLAVVVNGVCTNYLDVADEHGLDLRTDCDSEVVLRLVEAAERPAVGLDNCLQLLHGGMAAAVLDAKREIIWLARNDARPLWMFRLLGINGFFFASTDQIVLKALSKVFGRSAHALLEVFVPLAPATVTGISSLGSWVAPVSLPAPKRNSVHRGFQFAK